MTEYEKALTGDHVVYHKNYRICKKSYGSAFHAYDKGEIQYLSVAYAEFSTYKTLPNDITVGFRNGEVYTWKTKYITGYNAGQFGIAVSFDGKYVFAQTWENGLFCLDAKTGEHIWRTKSRRGITHIFVNDDTIVCQQHDHAMLLLDMHTGEVLIEKRPCTAWGFTALDHHHIICQVTARKWEIIDTEALEAKESFSHKQFTGDHPEFCIKEIFLKENNTIHVHGFQNVWDDSQTPPRALPNLEFDHEQESLYFKNLKNDSKTALIRVPFS